MQVTEITLKGQPLIDTAEFFEETNKALDDVPVNREAWFVVQDYTRPHGAITNCIIARAIEKLGVDRVAIVISSGMHRPSSQSEMNAMLGNGVTTRVRVYSHNVIKTFAFPKEAYVIGVHATTPHSFVELSHAGKMFTPGLLNYKDAANFHAHDKWDARRDMEAVGNNGFDKVFDYCINLNNQMIKFYVGGCNHWYEQYLMEAKDLYKVEIPAELPDVAVLEPWIKTQDFLLAMNAMTVCKARKIVKSGGTVCICSSRPDHMGTHYLFQQPNGRTPATYDKVFKLPFRNANIAFCMPNIPRVGIQEYFDKNIFYFTTSKRFYMFVRSLYGDNAVVHEYHGSDMMIGED